MVSALHNAGGRDQGKLGVLLQIGNIDHITDADSRSDLILEEDREHFNFNR